MDASTITLLVSLFGPALWGVFKTLLEKGSDLALGKGMQPLKDWIDRGYDDRKDAESLRTAVLSALDELKKDEGLEQYDALFATLRLTGLDRKTQFALAGAAVEMTHYAPDAIPTDILGKLNMEEKDRALLARFLFTFREKIKDAARYKDGIAYANEMDGLGLLRGLASQMVFLAEKMDALVSMEDALIVERRLTTDDANALKGYLADVREKWEGLMLPLIRKKSGDVTSAKLKQVYVPLYLRDMCAEEAARRHMEKSRQPEKMTQEEQKTRPVEIGELLNRYPKFILLGPPGCGKTTLLDRIALAFAEGRAASELGWKGENLFPIFLRLRNFGKYLNQNRKDFPEPCSGALVAYLENQFRDGERVPLTADFFDKRLQEGNCLVLMDGLDEVSDLRVEVAAHIDVFVARYVAKGNRFGLASRPRGYESVELQLRRTGLAVAEVNPLDLKGICQLIDNLLRLIEPDAALRAIDLENLTRAIGASDELTRIAGTPLFCSALVQVYKYNGARLPNRRVDVFDEIVDLLLGYWRAQQRHLSEAEQLAIEDGTGKQYREVKDAVTVKQRRLSHLAAHMQNTRQTEIAKEEAENVLYEYLKSRERVPNDEVARTWAENFLVNSHERSGLLVERDLGIYSFLHKGFMEYLAASALVNQSKTLVDTLLSHIEDEWWEQVILLAGAHPKLSEDLRSELVMRLLEIAETFALGSEERLHCIIVAGELARDMAESLPGPEHEQVETVLHATALDDTLAAMQRASAADTLDELGYHPDDLFAFVSIPNPQSPDSLIARYPVTNAQYERFLKPENFKNQSLWNGFPKFSEPDKEGYIQKIDDWGAEGWDWLQGALKSSEDLEDGMLQPRYWRNQRFGITRQNVPVVGISWYEANAYCRWLLENWDILEEGKQGLSKPREIRLPTETEWVLAAGGEQDNRFAWGSLKDEKEITRFANTGESGINRTTPVWMYPQGKSPLNVMDLSGNVWEWQANFRDKDHDVLALRSGSWVVNLDVARVSGRNDLPPNVRGYILGFRVVAFPS
jgi:formylglycine-generating enzyme required for sulfatase activity